MARHISNSAVHLDSDEQRGKQNNPKVSMNVSACPPCAGMCQNTHSWAWICWGLVEWCKGKVWYRGHPRKGSPDCLLTASKVPLLTEGSLRKDLISPYIKHVPKIDIDSKSDESDFRSACISSLWTEPPQRSSGWTSRVWGDKSHH